MWCGKPVQKVSRHGQYLCVVAFSTRGGLLAFLVVIREVFFHVWTGQSPSSLFGQLRFLKLHKPGVLEFLQKSCKVKEVKDSLVGTLFLVDS